MKSSTDSPAISAASPRVPMAAAVPAPAPAAAPMPAPFLPPAIAPMAVPMAAPTPTFTASFLIEAAASTVKLLVAISSIPPSAVCR
ncbi:MAG: hypothetical protein EXQ56_02135 [Acidobacteria bacterium]|nr:hypothetical protein [Acidobacteriota bacterium]